MTAEDMAHLEGYAEGGRVANNRARVEIDAAYLRGVDDGRDSISVLPIVLVGAVSGALAMLGFLQLI